MERVICAATYWDDGVARLGLPINIKTGLVFAGWRHGNTLQSSGEVFKMLYGEKWLEEWKKFKHKDGFLTSEGRFVDRSEGYKIALDAKQIDDHGTSKILTSEDLY